MKETIIGIVVIVLIGFGAWAVSSRGNSTAKKVDNVVAVVNGEEITRSAYDTLGAQLAQTQKISTTTLDVAAQTQFKDQIVNSLVAQALLRQAIEKSGIITTDVDIDAQIKTIKGQFETDKAYQDALATQGMTEEGLRTQIATELTSQSYFEQKLKFSSLTATTAEIDAAYKQASTGGQEVPPLEQVRDQVKQLVLQQKQQALIAGHVEELKKTATIEVRI